MRSIRLLLMLSSALALPAMRCAAQAPEAVPYHARTLPQPREVASPFSINAPGAASPNAIAFLSPEAISPQTRAAVRNAMPAIESKAALAGYDLHRGAWTYQQIACPVLPEDVLLFYVRNQGAHDLSRFSVVIPASGGVRVLPILRRSFTPYTPAPESPLTIDAFNRLRENGQTKNKPDWLLTGLCYAALAGAHVTLSPPKEENPAVVTPAMEPFLQINGGMNTVRFMDLERPQAPQEWSLTFSPTGELVHVGVVAVQLPRVKILP